MFHPINPGPDDSTRLPQVPAIPSPTQFLAKITSATAMDASPRDCWKSLAKGFPGGEGVTEETDKQTVRERLTALEEERQKVSQLIKKGTLDGPITSLAKGIETGIFLETLACKTIIGEAFSSEDAEELLLSMSHSLRGKLDHVLLIPGKKIEAAFAKQFPDEHFMAVTVELQDAAQGLVIDWQSTDTRSRNSLNQAETFESRCQHVIDFYEETKKSEVTDLFISIVTESFEKFGQIEAWKGFSKCLFSESHPVTEFLQKQPEQHLALLSSVLKDSKRIIGTGTQELGTASSRYFRAHCADYLENIVVNSNALSDPTLQETTQSLIEELYTRSYQVETTERSFVDVMPELQELSQIKTKEELNAFIKEYVLTQENTVKQEDTGAEENKSLFQKLFSGEDLALIEVISLSRRAVNLSREEVKNVCTCLMSQLKARLRKIYGLFPEENNLPIPGAFKGSNGPFYKHLILDAPEFFQALMYPSITSGYGVTKQQILREVTLILHPEALHPLAFINARDALQVAMYERHKELQ